MKTKRLALLVLFVIVYLAYFPLNRTLANANFFKFAADDLIPLVPIFSVPYLAYLPLLVLFTGLFFVKADEKLFRSFVLSGIIASLLSYLIFVVFPTAVRRPLVEGTDIFSQLVKIIYNSDRPYNVFPSGHTFNTVISALHLWRWRPKHLWTIAAGSILIILSTLLIKQHYLPDIIGGIALGTLATLGTWTRLGLSTTD